ncbi:MAG TPA: PKD domain-containing protein [Thermoplasmata archaeon]
MTGATTPFSHARPDRRGLLAPVVALIVAVALGVIGAVSLVAFSTHLALVANPWCPFQTGNGMELPEPGNTANVSPNATTFANGSVEFTSSASGCVPPYSFAWVFGDGTGSTAPNVVHVYPGPGNYSGSLTISDSGGHRAVSYFCVGASAWPMLTASSGSSPPSC